MKNDEFTSSQSSFFAHSLRIIGLYDNLSATQLSVIRTASAVLCFQQDCILTDTYRLARYDDKRHVEIPAEIVSPEKGLSEVIMAIQSGINAACSESERPTFVECLSYIFKKFGKSEEPFDSETKKMAIALIVGSALRASTHLINEHLDEDDFSDALRDTDGYKHFQITKEVVQNMYRFGDQLSRKNKEER